MSGSDPSFLIVIVLYNSAEWIGPTLDSIQNQKYKNWQTWVVDNKSKDDGAMYVSQSYPWARLVYSDKNLGFAGGNNLGVKSGPLTDIIFLVNPDVELEADCLQRLADAFAENPKLGVAGMKFWNDDRRTIQHVGGMLRANGLPYHLGSGEEDRGQYEGFIPCDYVQGAGLAVRRTVWEKLGGLDEDFFPAYFEETDFCKRVRDAGWQVGVVAEAAGVHHQDEDAQVVNPKFLRMIYLGRARYLIKHNTLGDWLFRFLPAEWKWLTSPSSKYLRRISVRALWDVWTGKPNEFRETPKT